MQERELFLSALEIEDPDDRQAHLQAACGDDAELLGRVQALLESHEGQSQFLNTPAIEQITEEPESASTIELTAGSTEDGDLNPAAFIPDGRDQMMKNGRHDDEIPLGYLQPSSEPDSLGRLGHYEILEVVGRGAFGTVLRAFDEKLQRVVAIKVLAPEMAATSPARKRFLREARTSAAVRHENVVSIYAVEDEPIPYLVMEYIPGKTLQQRLDEFGPLALSEVLRLGKQIADGLAAAHSENLIHRDVKPGNILLEGGMDERVKITDFGLARTVDDASMTQSGIIAGTPMYMAPEQAHGKKLDQRADLFSFGSVLYQMLSGRPPFRAPTTMAVLKRVTEDAPRPIREIIPEVPEWMSELIGHLHAKNPDERYKSAREVADLLDRCLTALHQGHNPDVSMSAASSRDVGVASQPTRPGAATRRRNGALLTAAALALFLLVVLSITELTGVTKIMANAFRPMPGRETLVAESDQFAKEPSSDKPVQEQTQLKGAGSAPTSPPPAKAPFDAEQAWQHQHAWADYLGVPVEKEISLGQDKDGKDVTLTMVLIPPGEFMIGATDDEQVKWLSAAKAEHPNAKAGAFATIGMEDQRFVRITKPFWLSKLEFTTGQFRRFVEITGYPTDAETNGQGATRPAAGEVFERLPELHWDNWGKISVDAGPVVNVSWNDAANCCEWLSSQHPDMAFSLPTEAQWEFACRAGTKNSLYDCETSEELREYAQFGDEVHFIQRGGQLRPNAFGLYDMLGNVTEWCSNWLAGYAASPTDDPAGPAMPGKYEMRAVRGGSFMHEIWKVRSSKRDFYTPDNCFFDRGFRVAAAITDASVQPIAQAASSKAEQSSDDNQPTGQEFASNEWIDVIPLIDPMLDNWNMRMTGKNEWRIEQGDLVAGSADDRPHKLLLPLDSEFSPSFECELDVTRRSGNYGFNLNFPNIGGDTPLSFDSPATAGVFLRQGQGYPQMIADDARFETGTRTVFRIEVRHLQNGDRVTVWKDSTKLGAWDGNRNQLFGNNGEGYPHGRRLSLWLPAGGGELAFHSIRVRMLDGGTVTTLRPLPARQTSQSPAEASPPAIALASLHPFAGFNSVSALIDGKSLSAITPTSAALSFICAVAIFCRE